jgi:butyryl-CoA dehydrogenase/short/branched chain acyl-CoA dehydrogenase
MTGPLTLLSEEDSSFQASVRQFAREQIAPHVREIDDQSRFKPELLAQMFALGRMGIEIPEEYGGQGGTFSRQCSLWRNSRRWILRRR